MQKNIFAYFIIALVCLSIERDSIADPCAHSSSMLQVPLVAESLPPHPELAQFDTYIQQMIAQHKGNLLPQYDIVVGVPCHDEQKSLRPLVEQLAAQYAQSYPGKKVLMVVIGTPNKPEVLATLDTFKSNPSLQLIFFPTHPDYANNVKGKNFKVRAFLRIAKYVQAEILMSVDADLTLPSDYVQRSLQPLFAHEATLVCPDYRIRPYDQDDKALTDLMFYPVVSSFYGSRVRHAATEGDFAISQEMFDPLLEQEGMWTSRHTFAECIITAVGLKRHVAYREIPYGRKLHKMTPPENIRNRFPDYFQKLARQLIHDSSFLAEQGDRLPGGHQEDKACLMQDVPAQEVANIDPGEWIREAKQMLGQYHTVYKDYFGQYPQVQRWQDRIQNTAAHELYFSAEEWAEIACIFLERYMQVPFDQQDQIANALRPFFQVRVAGFVRQVQGKTYQEMETLLHQQMEQFRIHKPRMQKIFALYRDIRRLIGQCPIGQIQVIWCVSSSPHPVYEITTSRGVYMFGALSHKYEFLPDQRRFIVSLMRRTQKQNLPFATPKLEANPAVQNPECETDRYVFRFQGKDYILQKKLTGVQKSFAHAQRADFYEVGYAAGQLHSAWRNVQLEGKRGRAVDLTESMKVLAARIPQWDTLVMRLKTKQDQAEGLTPAEQFFLTNQEGLRTFFSKWVFFISSRIPQLSPSWQEGVRFSDLRFGNLLFDKEGKKVAGIFDFEMADRNVRILEFHNMLLGVGKDEFPWYDANAQEAVIEGYQCAATPLGSALNEAEIQGIKEVVIPWRILMEIDKAFFAPDHPKHLFSHPNMLSQFIRLWESVQQLTPIPQKQTNGHQPSGKISGVFSFSHISDQVSRAG